MALPIPASARTPEGANIAINPGTKINPAGRKLRRASDTALIMAFIVFLALNAFKITLFNYYLLPKQTAGIFEYKLLMTMLLVIAIYPAIYRLRSKVLLIAVYIVQAVYIVVNIAYFRYFHSYLHIVQSLSLLKEGASVADNSAVPLSPQMLVAFIDLPFFIILLFRGVGSDILKKRLRTAFKTAAAASLCLILAIEFWNFMHSDSIVNLVHDTFSGESPIVQRYGTVVNNVVSVIYNSNNKALTDQLKYGKVITSGNGTGTTQGGTENSAEMQASPSAEGKPNYVIIQVESMDANIVNQQYKGNYVTPFLHSLTSSSIYYPYVMSYHEGGGTSDSEFSILNSVEPLQYYPALKLSSYGFSNSLVSRLDAGSYSTYAFHGNVGSFYNRDVAFPKIGFEKFYDMLRMKLHENGWGLPDNEVFDYTLNTLKAAKQPFFSYTITMTSHEPFNSARHYYNNSLYDDIGDVTVQNYYNSFSYVDESIKNFVNEIKKNFKNTYIIIYGDHTPNINTDMYKQASFTMDGRYFEFVPMFIISPDGKVRRETKMAGSFLDVAPTVLETSGINFKLNSDGENLTTPLADDSLPFKGGSYDRMLLFEKASATPVWAAGKTVASAIVP